MRTRVLTLLVLQASLALLLPQDAAAQAVRPGAGHAAPLGAQRPALPGTDRPGRLLSHSQAVRLLQRAGLGWVSSGGCADRGNRRCTSFEKVRAATLRKVIRLKRRSGCPVVLTGGTETGHEHGRYSHGTGYKVDVAPNPCIDRYITGRYPADGLRDDGARLYRSARALYARTPSHWDILFR
ncbi:hypothetical protein [Planomonospora venezuelensis]|uniref:Peptidase M15 n=1 Tax=Planomonospora venezuelensis TaxID=1999 RepID=A0A841DBB2_PLAVE|nr:hypothetical protein [Planomonospora venezuelensis]MBB5966779.1 hypothetical protein [Planomonospora venezuelensis]GIN01718.1 hypothetical protein Pve01_33760 [Planomonospora venezuelensis]